MNVEFLRAATAAILAISLAEPAFSQDDFLTRSAPILPETRAPSRPKPDLIVTHGSISPRSGDNVIVGRVSERFDWAHRTKNDGTAAATTRSDTAVVFGSSLTPPGAALPVPRLTPGQRSLKAGSFTVDFSFSTWSFGTHPTRICADALDVVTEKSETNNCLTLEPIHLVPKSLKGRISGQHIAAGVDLTLNWTAEVSYDFARANLSSGVVLDYVFDTVDVVYKLQANLAGGCTESGTGTYNPPVQGIRLKFNEHLYKAENTVAGDFHFPVTLRCPDAPPITFDYYPAAHAWFTTDGYRRFPEPLIRLFKSYVFQAPGGTILYTWNLKAE